MRSSVKLFIIFTLIMLNCWPGFSQRKIVEGDSIRYEFSPLVVTGSRYTLARENLAAAITVIEKPVLLNAPMTTVAEAVSQFTPGAFTTRRSIMGFGVAAAAAGGITLRGMGGKPNTQILILIDGRPDFQGIFGHPLPDAYPLDYVERIEVLRGPASAVYGTNSMGGVINIITREIDQPGFETRISTGFGSYQTQAHVIQHGGKLGKFAYYLTGNYQHTQGHRPNSGFDSQSYSLKMSYDFNSHFRLRVFGSTTPYRFHDPGPENGKPDFEVGDVHRSTMDFTLENKFGKTNGSIKIHGNFGEHDLSDGWHSIDQTVGVVAFQNFNLPAEFKTTIELDAKQYGGLGENKLATSFIQNTLGEEYITEVAGFVHLQKIFFKKLITGAGLRLENHSKYGSELVPQFGIVYQPLTQTSLRTSVSKGFRSPTARELFFFPTANIDLKPETLWSYEAGISHTLTHWLNVDLTYYMIQAANLIRLDTSVRPNRTVNTGKTDYNGLELAIQFRPIQNLSGKITYNYLNSEEIIPFSPNKFFGQLNYSWNRLAIGGSIESVQNLYSGTAENSKIKNYTLVGIQLMYQVIHGLEFSLNMENAGNTDYEILKGYPMPGRTFMGKINYQF